MGTRASNSKRPYQVTAFVIGAGSRGSSYSKFSLDLPERFKVVGVTDPRKFYRDKLKNKYGIAEDKCFESWEAAVNMDKFADCVIVATPDRLHRAPAIAFAQKGYHVLLEKPMAVTAQDCVDIVKACESSGVILAVCHVLRYAPQSLKIKELIDSGAIGTVVNIQLLEPVGFWHFCHSYVRGNWRNTDGSSFSLLAKSCHDIDLIQMWMGDRVCQSVSSFGSLHHFRKENKPAGAADRCLDCSVEAECPYSAKKHYIDGCIKQGHTGFPVKVITEVPDLESVTEALKTGPYGRCVYNCDNDVMDNQVVTMQYEGGATVSFSMVAFTEKVCERQVRIFGTKGEITCDYSTLVVEQFDFATQRKTKHGLGEGGILRGAVSSLSGHGGADFYLMESFINAIAFNDPSQVLTGPQETLSSHLLTFAAEKARLENRVVDLTKESVL